MAILRTDIERALDDLIAHEEGMRFQGLAVTLGKRRWPELVAQQRKKDGGLDAYAPASETPEGVGKGLAASISATPEKKVPGDAAKAKENFPDLRKLMFVTPRKVGNSARRELEETVGRDHGLELLFLEREEIVLLLTMPENGPLCATFLGLPSVAQADLEDLVARARRAAAVVVRGWQQRARGKPYIELAAVRIGPEGRETEDVFQLEKINEAVSQGGRIVLEGPGGSGKTTTLIQLAQRTRTGVPVVVDLPAWTASGRHILEYITGMPVFQAEQLGSADLARVQQAEPLLLLLNGWNEVGESISAATDVALRELDREFLGAGIVVATRTHHLVPPLPGALRLRLLPLGREKRAAYLAARLGGKAVDLRERIEAEPSLDGLTRTPFILAEVASLFEVGAAIPDTKLGILAQVLDLHEQREEHRNPLATAPVFGRQGDFLKALACAMTRRAGVDLSDADACEEIAAVAQELASRGQIEPARAPAILATLTAHHVLERVDYPETAFRFQHQQLQEYYAALKVRAGLARLLDSGNEARDRFVADHVNDPAWAEPVRMCAEELREQRGDRATDLRNARVGAKLVELALAVDLVFAGELARLCGGLVWDEVRAVVGERFRSAYAIPDANYREHAVAAMLASGAGDFSDIVTGLLSASDRQTRLSTYRLWPDIELSSLGPGWRGQVRAWPEEARVDLVGEMLEHWADDDVVSFAVDDGSVAVKEAAVSGLIWTESEEGLTRVLESMDAQTFERVARREAKYLPAALLPKAVAAMRKFVDGDSERTERLRTGLYLIDLGEKELAGSVRDGLSALSGSDLRNADSYLIRAALEHMHGVDAEWTGRWVVAQLAEGALPYGHAEWLRFATVVPDETAETLLHRLKTEDLSRASSREGMIAVLALRADADLAGRVFAMLRDRAREVEVGPGRRREVWTAERQLAAVLDGLPAEVVAGGIIATARSGDSLDIKVAAEVLGRVSGSELERLRVGEVVRARLRAYLKGGVDVVLGRDDFNGDEKGDLACSIARVGEPEDMADLVRLIHADIERVRRGRAARAAGDRGPVGNGAVMDCAGRHVGAVVLLDSAGADEVLVDLLGEPEYASHAAAAMARDFEPRRGRSLMQRFAYDTMWAARGGAAECGDEARRRRLAAALNAMIGQLRESGAEGDSRTRFGELAKALAAIDAHGSAVVVLDFIAMPRPWEEHAQLAAAERLLMAGVVLPATALLAFVDTLVERTAVWQSDSDRELLCRALALCPFIDDPAVGIARIREVLGKQGVGGYRLRGLFTALGESRSDAAVDLVYELAFDEHTFRECEDEITEALVRLDTQRSRKMLLGFVDPDVTMALTGPVHREDLLVARLVDLAKRRPEAAARLRELCERELPERNRHVLSKVLGRFGSLEDVFANLALVDDDRLGQIPAGVWEQLEAVFVERRRDGEESDVYTLHARASNELRARLLEMAHRDPKRRKSALKLLGQIEVWRLEYGRPTDEPRHPDLASGHCWPPTPTEI